MKILSTELIYLISSSSSHQEVYLYCEIDYEIFAYLCVKKKDAFNVIKDGIQT